MVQLSFTLPVPHDKRAEGAALQLAGEDGHGPGDGRARQADGRRTSRSSSSTARSTTSSTRRRSRSSSGTSRCWRPRRSTPSIKQKLRRKLVVVGACIGTDAHTVGIDAILNIKGFAGEKGLEYYRELRVVNLGAQVGVPELVEAARAREGRRGAGQPGRHPARRAPAQHPGDVGGVPGGTARPSSGRCSSSAAPGSTR